MEIKIKTWGDTQAYINPHRQTHKHTVFRHTYHRIADSLYTKIKGHQTGTNMKSQAHL